MSRHDNLIEQLTLLEKSYPDATRHHMHVASQTVIAVSTHEVLCDILELLLEGTNEAG